jgi:hypothetical protein
MAVLISSGRTSHSLRAMYGTCAWYTARLQYMHDTTQPLLSVLQHSCLPARTQTGSRLFGCSTHCAQCGICLRTNPSQLQIQDGLCAAIAQCGSVAAQVRVYVLQNIAACTAGLTKHPAAQWSELPCSGSVCAAAGATMGGGHSRTAYSAVPTTPPNLLKRLPVCCFPLCR